MGDSPARAVHLGSSPGTSRKNTKLRTAPYGKCTGPRSLPDTVCAACLRSSPCLRTGIDMRPEGVAGGGFKEVSQVTVQLRSCSVLRPLHPGLQCLSMAPLPATSHGRLLWQMFGCAMATPEQDVPLDRGRDKPTLTGRPRCSLPQRLMAKNHSGPGRGRAVFVPRERQSQHPLSSEGSEARDGGDVCARPRGVPLLLLQGPWVCFPLPFRAMLRKQGGEERFPSAGSDLCVSNHRLPHCYSNGSWKDYFVPRPVLSTSYSQ